jgi:hypothetical protein
LHEWAVSTKCNQGSPDVTMHIVVVHLIKCELAVGHPCHPFENQASGQWSPIISANLARYIDAMMSVRYAPLFAAHADSHESWQTAVACHPQQIRRHQLTLALECAYAGVPHHRISR